jgi:hypothetical protein
MVVCVAAGRPAAQQLGISILCIPGMKVLVHRLLAGAAAQCPSSESVQQLKLERPIYACQRVSSRCMCCMWQLYNGQV